METVATFFNHYREGIITVIFFTLAIRVPLGLWLDNRDRPKHEKPYDFGSPSRLLYALFWWESDRKELNMIVKLLNGLLLVSFLMIFCLVASYLWSMWN